MSQFKNFGPLEEDREDCPLCKMPVRKGDYGTLLAFKSVPDNESIARAAFVHEKCAQGLYEFFIESNTIDDRLYLPAAGWVRRVFLK